MVICFSLSHRKPICSRPPHVARHLLQQERSPILAVDTGNIYNLKPAERGGKHLPGKAIGIGYCISFIRVLSML
jgi:hypothetical protein